MIKIAGLIQFQSDGFAFFSAFVEEGGVLLVYNKRHIVGVK